MRPFIALLCLFAPIGCGGSDQNTDLNVPASTMHKTISPSSVSSGTQKDTDAANARLGQTVALARVHLKHEEYEQAEKLLQQALADPIATDKIAAISLLDEAKTAREKAKIAGKQQQDLGPRARPVQDTKVASDTLAPNPPKKKQLAKKASSPAEQRIEDELSKQTEFEFTDTPFSDAIGYLADLHQITIILDETALEDEGVSTDEPVTLTLSGITLRSALKIMLERLTTPLTYTIEDEVMKITTKVDDAPVPATPPKTAIDKARQPVVKQPATNALISELEKKAKRADTAKDALVLYDKFLERRELTGKQAGVFDLRRKSWKEKADQGLVRLGKKWVKAEEAETAAQEADTLIGQAYELIKVNNFNEVRKLLERASQIDRNGIRADFILGILNSTSHAYAVNFPKNAKKHFRAILTRSPNHISALNNLALAEVKLRQFLPALNHWRQAVELAPTTPEVTQNLGRLISEASKKKLPVPQTALTRFSRLYSKTIVSGKGKASNLEVGWLYMPLVLPKAEKKREQDGNRENGTGRLIEAGSGTGFVVHENYILTNRHVVDDKTMGVADAIRIVDPADPKHERKLEAKVVALSDELDLAILKCELLKAPPLTFTTEMPRRATEILVVGFPMGDEFGRNVKSTRGVISALPDPFNDNRLFYDATTNPGNSGGPVCDKHGNVVAVHSIGKGLSAGFTGKLAGGIPAAQAIPFIKQKLPKFDAKNAPGPEMEWPDVDEKVSQSTVMLITYNRAVDLGLAIAASKTKGQGSYLEDRSCTACNGSGYSPCPRKGCSYGKITKTEYYTTNLGTTRKPVIVRKFRTVKQRCPVCDGKNRVPCPYDVVSKPVVKTDK